MVSRPKRPSTGWEGFAGVLYGVIALPLGGSFFTHATGAGTAAAWIMFWLVLAGLILGIIGIALWSRHRSHDTKPH